MKKFFSFFAALLFAGSMMADSFTVTFKECATCSSSDSSDKQTTVEGIVAEGADFVSDVAATNVYQARPGRGVKLGTSKAAGELTLTLAEPVEATAITVTARKYNDSEKAFTLQGQEFTAADGDAFEEFTLTYEAATEISSIALTSPKRIYFTSVTVFVGETPAPTMAYYVCGSMTDWGPKAEYKLAAAEEGLFKGEFTFAANDEFKVVYSDGATVTDENWFPSGMDNNFKITEDGDYIVTFNPEGNVEGWWGGFFDVMMKEKPLDPTNCAEAAAAALSVSGNNVLYNDGAVYSIQGYVTEIATAWSSQYKNISFWMADEKDGGKVLQAFRAACETEEEAPGVGDLVTVTGSLTKYNSTPEFAAGCTFVIDEKAQPIVGEAHYYVCGTMTEWGVNADYELVANPANEGEFMGEFTFEAGAKLKVIKDNGTEGLTWYPDGMDNDYEITETGVYRIYFRPEGGVEGWYHGFFNVLMKEIPTYNVAEAIAAGLAENDEVFVRGVITKMEFKGKNFAKYGSVNIYVADATGAEGEFEFYNCYSLEADTFRASVPEYDPESTQWAQFTKVIDGNGVEVCVGDTVIAFGKYKLYNTTHELNTGCFLTDIKKGPDQPGETIEIQIISTSATVKYVDNCESYGWWQVQAQNADYYITLSNAGSIASAPGTYTVADLDPDYTYLYDLATSTKITFVDGSMTLSVDEEGNVFFLGEFLGDDNNTYVITIIYAADTDTKHQYDDDSDFIVDFESYEVDETYLAQYHSVNVLALDEAGNYINLDVTLADEAEAFEAGVYPIDEEYLPQTVHAGYFDEGHLIASFAAIRTDAGISRVWYLVSGTVTVDEDLNVAVDAVNSLGHAIKVNLKSGKHQGVEAVKAENGVVKSLKNGMLLIEKNGVQFNTVGQIVR